MAKKSNLKSVVIFGRKVKVLYEKIEVGLCGYYDPTKHCIYISKDLDDENRKQTLMHEIVHAILHRTGMNQTKMSHDHHELVCENIATFLTETFDFDI